MKDCYSVYGFGSLRCPLCNTCRTEHFIDSDQKPETPTGEVWHSRKWRTLTCHECHAVTVEGHLYVYAGDGDYNRVKTREPAVLVSWDVWQSHDGDHIEPILAMRRSLSHMRRSLSHMRPPQDHVSTLTGLSGFLCPVCGNSRVEHLMPAAIAPGCDGKTPGNLNNVWRTMTCTTCQNVEVEGRIMAANGTQVAIAKCPGAPNVMFTLRYWEKASLQAKVYDVIAARKRAEAKEKELPKTPINLQEIIEAGE